MQKCVISPSIAAGNILNFAKEIELLEKADADYLHIDVMDGHFVPLLTLGVPFVEAMKKVTKLPLDVHIMVSNPDIVAEDYLKAGADILTFHTETAIHSHRMVAKIHEYGKKAGIALNPATNFENIKYVLKDLDMVTIMTVNPGYSRQKHIISVQQKIKDLREYCDKNNINIDIQVDGGVSIDNIKVLSTLGANVFVAGGAIFGKENYYDAIVELKKNCLN